MKNNFTLLFFIIFWTPVILGQTLSERMIQGKILVGTNFTDGVNIKNETTHQATVSRIEGYFQLVANEGDVLIFTAVHLETFTKIVTKQDLTTKDLKIEMHPKSIILNDVIINSSGITAEKLGIPMATKKFSPAERKLQTATKGSLDGILNAFSGRTQMLKKEIIIEKKEQLLQKLEYLFEEKFYTDQLKIPKDYIKGFQYYCVEDLHFINSLKTKNKTMSEFLIIKLAERYNQILSDEGK